MRFEEGENADKEVGADHADRRVPPRLALSVGLVDVPREGGDVGDGRAGVDGVGLVSQRLEHGRHRVGGGRVGVVKRRQHDGTAKGGLFGGDEVAVGVEVGRKAIHGEIHEVRDERRSHGPGEDGVAGPEVALREGNQVKTGDDAEAGAATAPQGPKQVLVLARRGLDNLARREDDFERAHVVARPPAPAGEVRDAAAEDEAAHADVGRAAADDGETQRLEDGGDLDPAVAGADRYGFLIARDDDLVEIAQVQSDAALGVGGTGEGGVAAALDGKGHVVRGDDFDGGGHFFRGPGGDEAGGLDFGLPVGPVGVGLGVRRRVGEGDRAGEGGNKRSALMAGGGNVSKALCDG